MVDFSRLLAVALRYLAQRDHSCTELKTKLHYYLLRRAPISEDSEVEAVSADQALIQQVIDYCLAHHYLNDPRFVAHFIEYKMQQGYGQYAIRQLLQQKGIPASLIHTTLQQLQPDWSNLVKQLIAKKFPTCSLDSTTSLAEKRKIYQFLLRRGYQVEDFSTILNNFFI